MLTLNGLRNLWEKRKKGEPLPEDWTEQARHYFGLKKRAIKKNLNEGDSEQLQEAETLFKLLLSDVHYEKRNTRN